MAFKHEVRESKELVKRSDHYMSEVAGYDVMLNIDEHTTELAIWPSGWEKMRLGIIRCNPKNVADLEKFADEARDLFLGIAKDLREMGKRDLRSSWDKREDEFRESLKQFAAKVKAGAEPESTTITATENTK